MTREEIIKSALKFLVLKQTEQGSWGYSDRNENEISWNKVLEWLEKQSCGDCISRQAVFDIAKSSKSNWIDNSVLFKRVSELPPAEPERKVGKWHLLDECSNEGWYCDQCHKKVFKVDFSNTMRKYKFCPNCGAKMEVN